MRTWKKLKESVDAGFKTCTRCNEKLPVSQFHKEIRRKCGLAAWCKKCGNEWRRDKYNNDQEYRQRKQNQRKLAQKVNPRQWTERMKNSSLVRDYGITLQQYNEILSTQNFQCGICSSKNNNQSGRAFHVDHCHETGEVRGLLCHRCNTQLGVYERLKKDIGFEIIEQWLRRTNAISK